MICQITVALAVLVTLLVAVVPVVPAQDQSTTPQPSALPRPEAVTPPSPATLIGLYVGGWSHPQYGRGDMEVRVTKVTNAGKAEGTINVLSGLRPTGGHVKFYDGRVTVQNGQVILTFRRYAGPAVVNYSLQLGGDGLNGQSEVYGVVSEVKLIRRQ